MNIARPPTRRRLILLQAQLFAALGLSCLLEDENLLGNESQLSTNVESSTSVQTPYACENPQPILHPATALATGFVRCADGLVFRETQQSCGAPIQDEDPLCAGLPNGSACASNAECTELPNGICAGNQSCTCHYQCETDNDCEQGQICACAGVVSEYSVCVFANCTDGTSCGDGLCALDSVDLSAIANQCGRSLSSNRFNCLSALSPCHANDECGDSTCENGQGYKDVCAPAASSTDPGQWECADAIVCDLTCGRPYLVDGRPAFAKASASHGWEMGLRDRLPHDVELAEFWLHVALAEHASVASFARTTLHLMALAAPAELLQESAVALSDEIRHASLAFSLASGFGANASGPSAFPMETDSSAISAEAMIVALVYEACVGETLSAAEIGLAASRCTLKAPRDALESIAADEMRHAALGWKTLKWLLADNLDRRDLAQRTLASALAEVESRCATRATSRRDLEFGGKLNASTKNALYRDVIRNVIEPTFAALINAQGLNVPVCNVAPVLQNQQSA